MKDDLHFLRLLDLYSPLLTATQREITSLYFNYDLSLGEIAEQKGVSRQSVSDCLQKCRKQLEKYDEKLCFDKLLTEAASEYTAYKNAVEGWLETQKALPALKEKVLALQEALDGVHRQFGAETFRQDEK